MSGTTQTDLGLNAQALIDTINSSTTAIVNAITALQTEQASNSTTLLNAVTALSASVQSLDAHTKEAAAIVEYWHQYGIATAQANGAANTEFIESKLNPAIVTAHNAAVTGVTT